MSRTTLAVLKAEAALHGATVEEDAGALQAVAPDGFHWVDSDAYHIAMPYGADEDRNRAQAMADGLARMRLGTRVMTVEEADMAGDSPELATAPGPAR